MRKSFILALLLTTGLSGAGGCTAEQLRYVNAAADYSKPGAPVELKYAFSKSAVAGSPVPVNLQFVSKVAVDKLTTRITVSDGLRLNKSPTFAATQLKAGAPLSDQIEVTPSKDGQHYINVFVETEVNGNKLMRAFAIPVPVGQLDQTEAAT